MVLDLISRDGKRTELEAKAHNRVTAASYVPYLQPHFLQRAEIKVQGSSVEDTDPKDNWTYLLFTPTFRSIHLLRCRHRIESLGIDVVRDLVKGINLVTSPQFNPLQATKMNQWFNNLKQPRSKKPVNIPGGSVWVETNSEELN